MPGMRFWNWRGTEVSGTELPEQDQLRHRILTNPDDGIPAEVIPNVFGLGKNTCSATIT